MTIDYSFFKQAGDLFENPITLVNVEADDQPLVYVNQKFCQLTGYPLAEILGKNCRFLQGPGTDQADVKRIERSIDERQAVFCDLLNYTKGGRPFYNRLALLPIVLDGIDHYTGMQIDSTAHVLQSIRDGVGADFDELKTNDRIQDRVGNDLMSIRLILEGGSRNAERAHMLDRAFANIRRTVENLPYRDEGNSGRSDFGHNPPGHDRPVAREDA